MIRAPRLQRFQSPTDILNGRSKSLPTDMWSYKLTGPGGFQYGLDTIFAEDTPPPDEANMALWIPVADGQRRDGVGDLLEVGGIDVERHRKNPLCLFDHGKKVDLPIGLFETRDNHRYTFEIDPVTKSAGGWAYFYQGKDLMGVTQGKSYEHALFCEQTFDMACKRLIRGGSIGYQVKAARELQPDYEHGTPKGLHLLKILMLEGSLVVLPANMDTVGKLLRDGVCCGKSLSPYLVKSLEPYAPERKTMVAVPSAESKKKIPPAVWEPGVGAKSVEVKKKAAPPLTGAAGTVQRTAKAVNGRPPSPPQPPKPPAPPRVGGTVKSVEGEEIKGFYEDRARKPRKEKISAYDKIAQALKVGDYRHLSTPRPATGIGRPIGSPPRYKDLRAKYRTKAAEIPRVSRIRGARGRLEKVDWSGETPAQESERGNYEAGEMAGHEPLKTPTTRNPVNKVRAAYESDRLRKLSAAQTAANGPATKVEGTGVKPTPPSKPAPHPVSAKVPVATEIPTASAVVKIPAAQYRRKYPMAQPAPGLKPPTPGTFRYKKDLRVKYRKNTRAIPHKPMDTPTGPNTLDRRSASEEAANLANASTRYSDYAVPEFAHDEPTPTKVRGRSRGFVRGQHSVKPSGRIKDLPSARGEKILFVHPGAKKPNENIKRVKELRAKYKDHSSGTQGTRGGYGVLPAGDVGHRPATQTKQPKLRVPLAFKAPPKSPAEKARQIYGAARTSKVAGRRDENLNPDPELSRPSGKPAQLAPRHMANAEGEIADRRDENVKPDPQLSGPSRKPTQLAPRSTTHETGPSRKTEIGPSRKPATTATPDQVAEDELADSGYQPPPKPTGDPKNWRGTGRGDPKTRKIVPGEPEPEGTRYAKPVPPKAPKKPGGAAAYLQRREREVAKGERTPDRAGWDVERGNVAAERERNAAAERNEPKPERTEQTHLREQKLRGLDGYVPRRKKTLRTKHRKAVASISGPRLRTASKSLQVGVRKSLQSALVQRAVILELNQKVVALARQLA